MFGCAGQTHNTMEPSSPLALEPEKMARKLLVLDNLVPIPEPDPPAQFFPNSADPSIPFWERFRSQMSLVEQYRHSRIDRHLRWFTGNQTYFDRVMGRGHKYIYHILGEIEARGLPVELALLPIVESAFDPFAYSHSHAAGLWQFIPSTAEVYGLKKDWWYDGRRDIVASTEAALTYLTYLHDLFDGDWLLALAAYNSGQGNVRRAIKRNRRAGKPADFWSLKLPKETKAYVPQLLAIAKVFQDPDHYNVSIPEVANKPFFTALELDNQINLSKAAEMAAIEGELLAELNPAYNRLATHPEGPHRLLLPVEKAGPFSEALASLPADYWRPNKTYQVKKGDSLYTIARRHRVTIGQLKALNNLNTNILQIGQRLQLPGFGGASGLAENRTPNARHLVKQGDTLWQIARLHRVSVNELMHWNQLKKGSMLQPGQELKLAENDFAYQKRMKKVNYKVRRGDSLSRIASKFNLKINDILNWNAIDMKGYLMPGQRLTLFVDIRNI